MPHGADRVEPLRASARQLLPNCRLPARSCYRVRSAQETLSDSWSPSDETRRYSSWLLPSDGESYHWRFSFSQAKNRFAALHVNDYCASRAGTGMTMGEAV